MSVDMGGEDRAAVKAPTVEVRECRMSADWKHGSLGLIPGSGKIITQYRIIVDGKFVDSFLTRARAEARAAQLRARAAE